MVQSVFLKTDLTVSGSPWGMNVRVHPLPFALYFSIGLVLKLFQRFSQISEGFNILELILNRCMKEDLISEN
jgi:hypothetical protein